MTIKKPLKIILSILGMSLGFLIVCAVIGFLYAIIGTIIMSIITIIHKENILKNMKKKK